MFLFSCKVQNIEHQLLTLSKQIDLLLFSESNCINIQSALRGSNHVHRKPEFDILRNKYFAVNIPMDTITIMVKDGFLRGFDVRAGS